MGAGGRRVGAGRPRKPAAQKVLEEGKQKLIDSFINSIYLYDDRFVITFNYKGESKTVTLDDINNSSLTSMGSPL